MRWYTFFCLLVVELCVCFALSVKAKPFKESGQLGIDDDSGSSEFGADESVDPDEARPSLHNHAKAFAYNSNEERGGMLEAVKGLFKTRSQTNALTPDEQLLQHYKVLSPNVVRPNNGEQLSNLPEPRDLFVSSKFTRGDLKNGRVITWLKYFDAHGRKHELSDLPERRHEVLNLLMSIDGVNGKDLSLLVNKAKTIPDLKTFAKDLKNDFKLESPLLDLLKKEQNTPEDIFKTLQIKTFSSNDKNFLQWLRYCQLYKTKYSMHKNLLVKNFDNRVLDLLKTEKSLDELVPLLTSIRETNGLKAFSDQLLVTVRGQKQIANWLKEGKNPGALYADLINPNIDIHEQLPNLVQWIKYVVSYNKNQGGKTKVHAAEFLIPERKNKIDLFYRAAIFDKLKEIDDIEDIVADVSRQLLRAMKTAGLTPGFLKSVVSDLPKKGMWETNYENVIDIYTKREFPTLLEAN